MGGKGRRGRSPGPRSTKESVTASPVVSDWQALNKELLGICNAMLVRLRPQVDKYVPVRIAHAFLLKATRTLEAVTLLYDHGLWEQAQVLVRTLIELRINFVCFLMMVRNNQRDACRRVLDAMWLEKLKQQRESKYAGLGMLPGPTREDLERIEKEIATRYSADEVWAMRKFGFTGLPIDRRAETSGHNNDYHIVFRNFSRNVHSTDYAELMMIQETRSSADFREYYAHRDRISLYTTHFSVAGMAEFANAAFKCNLNAELDTLGHKKNALMKKPIPTPPISRTSAPESRPATDAEG